jgi:hypothetical protein
VPNADLETALGYPIYAEIPDDRAVVRSITAGVPVVMADAKSDAGRAFLELGRNLAGVSGRARGARRGWPWRRSRDLDATPVPAPPNPVETDALLAAWAPAIDDGPEQASPRDALERDLEHSWEEAPEPHTRVHDLVTAGGGRDD